MKTSKTTGILTNVQRIQLRGKNLSANVKWNLFDLNKGRLTRKIKQCPEDFEILANSPHCLGWLTDSSIRDSLNELAQIISKINNFEIIPIKRLKATKKNGKRSYMAETINLPDLLNLEKDYIIEANSVEKSKTTPAEERERLEVLRDNYYLEKIKEKSSLRPNEWKLLFDYYKKNSRENRFFLPLYFERSYTWQQVKNELIKKSYTVKKISNSDLKPAFVSKREKVWNLIRPDIKQAESKASAFGFTLVCKLQYFTIEKQTK